MPRALQRMRPRPAWPRSLRSRAARGLPGRGAGGRAGTVPVAAAWAALSWCVPAAGQAPADPPDTFADAGVRALVLSARAARERDIAGIHSYEGTLRQRFYVGLTALRFRRERGLFEMERVARIRWSADGEHAIQWMGARTAIPIAGIDTGRPGGGSAAVSVSDSVARLQASSEVESDIAEEMLDETEVPGFELTPGSDRLFFGDDDWALHPLADTAGAHYRYASGDTLRLSLPPPNGDVVLHEVRVEPRRADFRLVAGSLWFDADRHTLVRATYKPARPFDMTIDEPEDAEDVPGILQPIEAEITYVTVEYSLQELEYWLPRRFAFEGEARVATLLRIPITIEWTVGGYSVNEASEVPLTGVLPEGWRRQVNLSENEDGDTVRVTVIVPTNEELRDHPGLSADFGQRAPTGFTPREIEELRGELEGLLPTYQRFRPRLAWGARRDLLRYNRVEGFSLGAAATVPLSPATEVELGARLGTGDREPGGHLTVRLGEEEGRWELSAFHRLETMGDWTSHFGVTSSIGHLLFGSDHGQYYRTTGAAAGRRWRGRRVETSLGVFHERQRPVELETDFFLLGTLVDDSVEAVLSAAPLDLSGARGTVRWFSGTDPHALVLTGRLCAEATVGDARYRRVWAAASASHPLPLGLAGAVEVGAGSLWGDEPLQRHFFLGASESLRGFHSNERSGASFWRGRAELATGSAAARIALFTDAGWAGPRAAFRLDDPAVSVGIGGSLLDGIFRVDVARVVRGGRGWPPHVPGRAVLTPTAALRGR